jgi:AAA domain
MTNSRSRTPQSPCPRGPKRCPRAMAPGGAADRFRPLSSAELLARSEGPDWLVRAVFPHGQLAVIGGPAKSGKTSIAVDLGYSLATGTKFLGHFGVPEPARVLIMSGESGFRKLKDTLLRVDASRRGDHALLCKNLYWSDCLPRLDDPADLEELQALLRRLGTAVVVVDPLYACLFSAGYGGASNLYAVGSVLDRFASACLDAGTTPILVHHTSKGASGRRTGEPPQLHDLAQAGLAEFVRAWLLVGPRTEMEPGSGRLELVAAIGGSAGHSSAWDLDITEGVLERDGSARTWDVRLRRYVGRMARLPREADSDRVGRYGY